MSNTAAIPMHVEDVQGDGRWMSQHNYQTEECHLRKPQVLFVGDSLIQRLKDTETWEKMFQPLNAVNAGIGGDSIQHVLWRLQNGLLNSCEPRVVVVMVGTNNHGNTADEVAEGLEAIAWCISNKLPSCKITILALLPRGEKPNILREKIYRINHTVEKLVTTIPNTYFHNADPGFIRRDGCISPEDMADFLHLTRRGYSKYCSSVFGFIRKLLLDSVDHS